MYDYRVVDYNKRNINNYLTISKRGVVHYYQDTIELLTINQYVQNKSNYYQLI